jgi:hypothetical protein
MGVRRVRVLLRLVSGLGLNLSFNSLRRALRRADMRHMPSG